MRTIFMAATTAALLIPCAGIAQQSEVEQAVATITQDDFNWRVGVIAHDSMQGRNTPSTGLDKTAEWLASEFLRMGLRGGMADGGFIQRYPLRSTVVDAASSFTGGDVPLMMGRDLVPARVSSGTEVRGDMVLLHGSADVDAALDDVDLAGKHLVYVLPDGVAGPARNLFGALLSSGAASVSWTNGGAVDAWDRATAAAARPAVRKGWGDTGAGPAGVAPMLQIRRSALARALTSRGVDLATVVTSGRAGTTPVPGGAFTLSLSVREETVTAPNVVAVLDGSDPELKDEYVIFSGHMDHVGMGTPDENGDSIFNGADDDASGTVAVVEVAEAMASLSEAPKRSMIFLIVSGEEKGLWGSEYYAENPSVEVDQMVANFNTDMVGRNWPDTIVAIGKEHSDLGETMNRVNEAHPELRMTAIDDIWPEENFYFRSDHYNFARKGVPVLFFFNGTHDDYHGRDDEPDRIDGEKAARIARLVFYLGIEVGNALERPRWNPESYARIVSDR